MDGSSEMLAGVNIGQEKRVESSVKNVESRLESSFSNLIEGRMEALVLADMGRNMRNAEFTRWLQTKHGWIQTLLSVPWSEKMIGVVEQTSSKFVSRMKEEEEKKKQEVETQGRTFDRGEGYVTPEQEIRGMVAEAVVIRSFARVLEEHMRASTRDQFGIELGTPQDIEMDKGGIDMIVPKLFRKVIKPDGTAKVEPIRLYINIKGRYGLGTDMEVLNMDNSQNQIALEKYGLNRDKTNRSISTAERDASGREFATLLVGVDTTDLSELMRKAQDGELDDIVRASLERELGIKLNRKQPSRLN